VLIAVLHHAPLNISLIQLLWLVIHVLLDALNAQIIRFALNVNTLLALHGYKIYAIIPVQSIPTNPTPLTAPGVNHNVLTVRMYTTTALPASLPDLNELFLMVTYAIKHVQLQPMATQVQIHANLVI